MAAQMSPVAEANLRLRPARRRDGTEATGASVAEYWGSQAVVVGWHVWGSHLCGVPVCARVLPVVHRETGVCRGLCTLTVRPGRECGYWVSRSGLLPDRSRVASPAVPPYSARTLYIRAGPVL